MPLLPGRPTAPGAHLECVDGCRLGEAYGLPYWDETRETCGFQERVDQSSLPITTYGGQAK